MKRTIWIFTSVIALVGMPVLAAECVTDAPPACVEGSGYFDNKEAEQVCRDAVKVYQKSVTAFWDCQREQGNAVNDESRKVIRLINCRIRGKETCE